MPLTDEQVMARGRTDDEVFHAPPSLARSAADWATSAIRGLARGGVAMAGQFGDIPRMITEKGHELGIPRPPEGGIQAFPGGSPFPGTEDLIEKVGGKGKDKNAVGKFMAAKAETPGGEYAESIGEMAAPSALGKGRAVTKALQAVGGGTGSQYAGDLAKKYLPDHETLARILGGIFGMHTPNMAARTVTPFPSTPERRAMVRTLEQEGVEPTAGDITGSRTLKYAEHGLGDMPGSGGRYTEAAERKGRQFTRAALERVGEHTDTASPQVVDRAYTRIGREFDDLSARNTAQMDPQYFTELFQHQHDYDHLFVDPLRRPIVENVIDHAVNQLIRSGTMDGEQYQALRSRIERMRRSYAKDPEMADFLGDVRRSMDDLMERSIRQNNPADLGAWQDARRQYRNMLVIEKAATGAGEDAAAGIISPAKLREAVVGQSRRGYARGEGDFAELARAGAGVLKPPPTSGTSERAAMMAVPTILGGGIGAALGGAPEAIGTAAAGVMAPGLTGRAIMSPVGQSFLGNQALPYRLGPGSIDALVRAAIAAKANEQDHDRR